ncbi:hypothetical protein BMS3Abin01_00969 [bacterium BMS3Abin01]|nr:hypothetical protein BMS3Abin01_00969 [bacterium BMS3Abin01]
MATMARSHSIPRGLAASGSGVVHFEGQGTISGSMRNGNLTISGACTVSVDSCRDHETLPSGAVRYMGVTGSFSVAGFDFTLTIDARLLTIKAAGEGVWQLRGSGTYTTGRRQVSTWDRLRPADGSYLTGISTATGTADSQAYIS